jgi:Family of unknown function (DUF6171)
MESSKKVTPFDLFKSKNYIDKEISDKRISECYSCEELIKITKQCKKCGCFMELKTKLKDASCPLGKW